MRAIVHIGLLFDQQPNQLFIAFEAGLVQWAHAILVEAVNSRIATVY